MPTSAPDVYYEYYPYAVSVGEGRGIYAARDWCCEQYGMPAPWIRNEPGDRWTWNGIFFVFRNYYDAFEFKVAWG